MAATVVHADLSSSSWLAKKPKEYTGKDLEQALKSLEKIDLNSISMPADAVGPPKLSLTAIKKASDTMDSYLKVLKTATDTLKKGEAAAKQVSSAASKTSSELQAMAKDKKTSDDVRKKCQDASSTASAIGAKAATLLSAIK